MNDGVIHYNVKGRAACHEPTDYITTDFAKVTCIECMIIMVKDD